MPTPAPPSIPAIQLSRAEFLWLSVGMWLGGIFILAVMPLLLIPRLGMPLGVAGSYFVFFLAWQPIQSITQRALGVKVAVLRMVVFVGAAAVAGYYIREMLLGMER